MEPKGLLLADGRIASSGERAIASLFRKTVRYNLQRAFTIHTWIAYPLRADGTRDGIKFEGRLRRDVIADVHAWRATRPMVVLHHDQHGAMFFCDDETAGPLVGTLVDAADRVTRNYTLEDKTGWEVGQ